MFIGGMLFTTRVKVSNEELVMLYKKETNAKKRERFLAMLHLQINNKSITEVAEIFCKSYNTVKSWRGRFLKHGPDGLDDKPRSGRPPKIENQTLDKFIKEANPMIPSLVAEKATKKTGVKCTAAMIRYRLNKMKWTRKVPMPVYFRRAMIEAVIAWQRSTKRWISRLRKDGFLMYVADQSNLTLDYDNKRGPWSPQGQRVYSRYDGKHDKIVVTAALSPDGRPVCWITDRFRAKEAVDFLKALMKRGKIALILDKSPVHRSRAVQKLIKDNPDRLRVRYFPTGWPELNAAERFWSVLKSNRFNFIHYESADDRITAVENFCNEYHFNIDVEKVLFAKPIAKTF